jgi:hypothetical protein
MEEELPYIHVVKKNKTQPIDRFLQWQENTAS